MVWARLDDAILDNPKIVRAGPLGFALHVAAITWCSRNLTDGFIPERKVKGLLPMTWDEDRDDDKACIWTVSATSGYAGIEGDDLTDQIVKILVAVELWREDWDERGNFGYRLNDYDKYNPTRAQVLENREQLSQTRSDAGKAGAAKRWQGHSKQNGKAIANAKQSDSPGPDPVPLLSLSSSLDSDPDQPVRLDQGASVRAVFDYWAMKLHPGQSMKFDEKRKKRIRARLAEGFSVDDLKLAIDGALKDDWLMGRKDGTPKNGYRDLKTILRDAEQVERLKELAPKRAAALPLLPPRAEPEPVSEVLVSAPEQVIGFLKGFGKQRAS